MPASPAALTIVCSVTDLLAVYGYDNDVQPLSASTSTALAYCT